MRPAQESLVRGVVTVLACWTIATHIVVGSGGNFYALLGLGPLAIIVGFVARALGPNGSPAPIFASALPDPSRRRGLGVSLFAAFSVAILLLRGQGTLFWWLASAGLIIGLLFLWRETPAPLVPPRPASALTPRHSLALWGLAAASGALALLLHKPENDDGFFIATAARAVDDPSLPLMTTNPTLGMPELALSLPAYKVHSFELLAAAISWVSGLAPIAVFHLLLGPLIAALVPLAYASLYRRVIPGRELIASAVTMVILLALPGTPYGGDPYTHPWLGNTIFLFLLVPLIGAAAWDLARQPDARRFLALACAQIAAIGVTSTALWAAPVTATYFGFAAMAEPGSTQRRLRACGLGLASCAYAVTAGLLIKTAFAAEGVVVGGDPVFPPPELGAEIQNSLGAPTTIALVWLCVLAAWAWQRERAPRNLTLIIPALFAATLMNPYLTEVVAANVTSRYVFYRIFWVLPVPVIMTLLVVAILESSRRWSAVARVVAIAVLVAAVGSASVWGGFVRFGWHNLSIVRFPPDLKVPRPAYDVAEHLHRTLGPDKTVLGLRWINLWLPTFREPPWPLNTRRQYLDSLRRVNRNDEVVQRLLVGAFLGGEIDKWRPFPEPIPDFLGYVERGLTDLHPDALFLAPSMVDREDLRDILLRVGYEPSEVVHGFAIWLRSDGESVEPRPTTEVPRVARRNRDSPPAPPGPVPSPRRGRRPRETWRMRARRLRR